MSQALLWSFALSLLATPIVLATVYYFVLPRMVTIGYRLGLPSDAFSEVDGSEGAGSIDLDYYTLYFDVSRDDLLISGPAPDALHWQIAAFDGATRLIDGAYLNNATANINTNGHFSVRFSAEPGEVDHSGQSDVNVLDCSSMKKGIIIFRIVLPARKVALPYVVKLQRSTTSLQQ